MDSTPFRATRRKLRATATSRRRCAAISAAWLAGVHMAAPATAAIGRTPGIADVTRDVPYIASLVWDRLWPWLND